VAANTPRSGLTARDIAQHLRRGEEPLSVAVDRFRNWTKMGIINPVGEAHPGTGRKKRYSHVALLEAALIQSLLEFSDRSAAELAGVVKGILVVMEHGGEFSIKVGESIHESTYTIKLEGFRLRLDTSPHAGMVFNLKSLFESYRLNIEDLPQLAHLLKNLKS
jgi:hypothetical protein